MNNVLELREVATWGISIEMLEDIRKKSTKSSTKTFEEALQQCINERPDLYHCDDPRYDAYKRIGRAMHGLDHEEQIIAVSQMIMRLR